MQYNNSPQGVCMMSAFRKGHHHSLATAYKIRPYARHDRLDDDEHSDCSTNTIPKGTHYDLFALGASRN
jgi:hypothetical protein